MSIEFSPALDRVGSSLPPLAASRTNTRRPPSARRLAANRANAGKSTGPRTSAGKKRASRNALKHGLCSTLGVRLPSECAATYALFVEELRQELRPAGAVQNLLFNQLATLTWRLNRLPESQAKIFEQELGKAAAGDGEELSPSDVLARRFSDDPRNGFILLERYERTMRNAQLRLLKQLEQLKKRSDAGLPFDGVEREEDRVPRQGSQPAWTEEKMQRQVALFARRKEESAQFIPPRDEEEASTDHCNRICEEGKRKQAKQTQSKPAPNVDSPPPKRKSHHSSPPPATERSHRGLRIEDLRLEESKPQTSNNKRQTI